MNLIKFIQLSIPIFLQVVFIYAAIIFFLTSASYIKGEDWNKTISHILKKSITIMKYLSAIGLLCFFILILLFICIFIGYIINKSIIIYIIMFFKLVYLLFFIKILKDLVLFIFKNKSEVIYNTIEKTFVPIGTVFVFLMSICEGVFTPFIFIFSVGTVSLALSVYLFIGKISLYIFLILIPIVLFGKFLKKILINYVNIIDKIIFKINLKESYKKVIPYISFIIWLPLVYAVEFLKF